MTFSVYSARTSFSEELVDAFSKIATTALAGNKDQLLAQNAANILIVSPFHELPVIHIGKKILHIVIFENEIKAETTGTYYVHQSSDVKEAVSKIVKRFLGFESNKSCVISPFEISNIKLPLLHVAATHLAYVTQASEEIKKTTLPLHKPEQTVTKDKYPVKLRRIHLSNIFFKRLAIPLGILVVWIISLPFVLLLMSGVCAYGAYKSFPSKQSILVAPLLKCSILSAQGASTLTQYLPIKSPQALSNFLYESAQLATEARIVYLQLTTLSINNLKNISPQLFKLSRDVSFLASRTEDVVSLSHFSKSIPTLFSHASLLHVAATAASQSEDLLGQFTPKNYLVLLQNNMELRPTGGFIGSFILLTVDNAEVTAQKLYDVYDADGQLSGYVKPPTAISNYLGEASWHLRDSNWDPDFAISAKRAEWFLDKSLNIQVDGVVGVDLEVLRKIIEVAGPLNVLDYRSELTADNFYAQIQTEVHKEFFPGSRKKSNYLTAVFNAVISKLNEKNGNKLQLLSGIFQNLDARDIQLYSNNEVLQSEFVKSGIAGEVSVNSLGYVEANVGVNKSNQYIERQADWRFTKGETSTRVEGSLNLINTASSQTDETKYRVYLRTFAPKGSVLTGLKVVVGGIEQAVVPEKDVLDTREQDGVFFEIKGGERAFVSVSWDCPPSTDILLWKQGGVSSYPVSITELTGGTSRQYNTTFAGDEHIQL